MNFYYIDANKRNPNTAKLLNIACKKRKIKFIEIDSNGFDYDNKNLEFQKGDLVYRAADDRGAKIIEKTLIAKEGITFYQSSREGMMEFSPIESIIAYRENNFPVPKAVLKIVEDRKKLRRYADYVGGFPLIIKIVGKSHGVGVIKIDSLSSLFSIVDYLLTQDNDFILMEFVDTTVSARLIVLGDKVIDSIEYFAPQDDFRSNAGKIPNVRVRKYSQKIQAIAVRAVKAKGLEFGGIDILIDKKGKLYITEVNFPCFFGRCQLLTGIDIAGMMLDYLLKKSIKIKKD